eukprot:scaffold1511_cov354-Pavlova_lutheri.AAC.1
MCFTLLGHPPHQGVLSSSLTVGAHMGTCSPLNWRRNISFWTYTSQDNLDAHNQVSSGRSNETSPTQGLRPTRLLRSCAIRDCESPFFVKHRSLFHLYLVTVSVYNPLVCLSKLVLWLDGLGQVVKRQQVVQQPKFLALCVWRRFHVELGGAENQSAPRAEIRKVRIQLQDPVGSPRWLLAGG